MNSLNECLTYHTLSSNIHPQPLDVQSDGEIVNISGCLSIKALNFNPFYRGYDVLQLENNLYPEKNLYFVTLSPNSQLIHFILLSHGRLLLSLTSNQPLDIGTDTINVNINYHRAFGMRVTLLDFWQPYSMDYRFPSISKTGDMVFLSGVMMGKPYSSSHNTHEKPFAVLPMGYRPNFRQIYTVATLKGKARVDILPNGWCQIFTPNHDFVSLDGIHFLAHNPLPPIKRLYDYSRTLIKISNPLWRNYGKGYPPLEIIVYFGWVMLNGVIRKKNIKMVAKREDRFRWETIGTIPREYLPPCQLLFHSDDFHLSGRLRPIVVTTSGHIKVKIIKDVSLVSFSNSLWKARSQQMIYL